MHISLDGFVAGPNGELNWVKIDQDLFEHVGRRIHQGDTALYGRVTYQMMEGYWPTAADKPNASEHDKKHSQWYQRAHKVVLSSTLHGADLVNTRVIHDRIAAQIAEVKQKAGNEVLIFGSPRATHTLMQLGLIDGYWLFVNPIILGQGIPLFSGVKDRVNLLLRSTHTFASGVTEMDYLVDRTR